MKVIIKGKGFPPLFSAGLTTLVICTIAMSAYLDRSIITILVQPMRQTLHITDTQIGLLQGVAFILFYAVMGIPLGRIVDRTVRKNLLAIGVLIWSVMTIACGFASSFATLFAARVGVGIGEALLAPAAFSMVADLFPPAIRGRAIAAVTLSGALGGSLSYILGGAIIHYFPTAVVLPIVGSKWNWQIAFLFAGCPGLVLSCLALLIREPGRHERIVEIEAGRGDSFLQYARARWQPFACVYVAHTLLATIAYGVGAWMAVYFMRRFGAPADEVGLVIGGMGIAAALCGGFGGGFVSDVLSRRRLSGRIEVLLLSSSVTLCFLIAWPLTANVTAAFALLGLTLLAIGTGTSTASLAIQEILPNHMRGQALGYYFLFQGAVAQGLGPIAVSLFKDHVLHDQGALGEAILSVCVPMAVVVGVLAFMGKPGYAAARQEILDGAGISLRIVPS